MICVQHDEDRRKLCERERAALEKRYTLPESSHIIVHPSRMAKSGKFDCTVMSLSVLLDYRPEDTKVLFLSYIKFKSYAINLYFIFFYRNIPLRYRYLQNFLMKC